VARPAAENREAWETEDGTGSALLIVIWVL